MRLTVVGCSGSFPGPGNPGSCYLVEADGFRALLDLGSGALGYLQQHCRVSDIDAVLVSHLHPDHCIDLLPLYVARTYDPERTHAAIPVHAPSGAAAQMATAYGRAEPPGLSGAFLFQEWTPGTREVGPLRVTVARVAHPVPTWALRVEHGGRSVVYSGDTGPTPALVELARGADLALFESSFERQRDLRCPADLHLTGEQAGQHATEAGVGRLVLTHLPPWNDPAVSLAGARSTYDGPLEVARPGGTYEL